MSYSKLFSEYGCIVIFEIILLFLLFIFLLLLNMFVNIIDPINNNIIIILLNENCSPSKKYPNINANNICEYCSKENNVESRLLSDKNIKPIPP